MERSLCVKEHDGGCGHETPAGCGEAGWSKWCSALGAPGVSAAHHGVCGRS